MKNLLINSFRKFKRYILKWKSRQNKVDYFAYLAFWIGIILGFLFINYTGLTAPWPLSLILIICIGAFLEGLFFLFYALVILFNDFINRFRH